MHVCTHLCIRIGLPWQVMAIGLLCVLVISVLLVLTVLIILCLKQKRCRKSPLQHEQGQGDGARCQTDPWEYVPEPAPPSYSESCRQEETTCNHVAVCTGTSEDVASSTSDSEQVDQDRTSNTIGEL